MYNSRSDSAIFFVHNDELNQIAEILLTDIGLHGRLNAVDEDNRHNTNERKDIMKKEMKEILKEEYTKTGYGEIADYCVQKIAEVVEMPDGSLIPIEKEDLRKHFCFGYGGIGDDYEKAYEMADTAYSDEDYFRDANMKEFREKLEIIDHQHLETGEMPYYVMTICKTESRICFVCFITADRIIDAFGGSVVAKRLVGKDTKFGRIPTRKEVELIKAGYQKAADGHLKKINAYLKRYGLKYIESWAYLRD